MAVSATTPIPTGLTRDELARYVWGNDPNTQFTNTVSADARRKAIDTLYNEYRGNPGITVADLAAYGVKVLQNTNSGVDPRPGVGDRQLAEQRNPSPAKGKPSPAAAQAAARRSGTSTDNINLQSPGAQKAVQGLAALNIQGLDVQAINQSLAQAQSNALTDADLLLKQQIDPNREVNLGGTIGNFYVSGLGYGGYQGGVLSDTPLGTTDAFALLYQMQDQNPAALADLQHRLFDAGFYGSTKEQDIQFGKAGMDTQQAWIYALGETQRESVKNPSISVSSVLDKFKGGGWGAQAGGGAGGAGGQGPIVNLTSEEDLKGQIQAAATSTLGHHLSDKQVSDFVAAFHAQQTKEQTAKGGQTVNSPIGTSAGLDQYLRERFPGEATATDFANTARTFIGLASGTGVPTGG